MIEREIASKLKHLAATFPVVTIEGPRQSGKTTLAKMVFPEYAYANLEGGATRPCTTEIKIPMMRMRHITALTSKRTFVNS